MLLSCELIVLSFRLVYRKLILVWTCEFTGPEVGRLAKIAGKYKVHLVMGVVERARFYLYNTMFFDSQGQHLGQHRKITLVASERAVWYSGGKSTLPIYETSIRKIDGLTG